MFKRAMTTNIGCQVAPSIKIPVYASPPKKTVTTSFSPSWLRFKINFYLVCDVIQPGYFLAFFLLLANFLEYFFQAAMFHDVTEIS